MTENFVAPPSELQTDYAAVVGRVAAAWSAIDFNVNLSIWALANVAPALGACMTSQIFQTDGRMKALLSMLKLRRAPQAVIKLADEFRSDLRGPQELRNRIVHDPWIWDGIGAEVYQVEIVAPAKLKFEIKETKLDELRTHYATINKLCQRSIDIKRRVYDALPTLPEIPQSELHPIIDPLRGQ